MQVRLTPESMGRPPLFKKPKRIGKSVMNPKNFVTNNLVKGWLKKEEENIRPYLQAWSGIDPYHTLAAIRFSFWTMIVVIVATIIWSVLVPNNYQAGGYSALVFFFGTAFFLWISARKNLKRFLMAVTWCENRNIPGNLLGKSRWEKQEVREVLRFFVPTIQSDILPLEEKIRKDYKFPKKSAEAKRRHKEKKDRITNNIGIISPMFGNFEGIQNPVAEAFRMATEMK